MWAGLNDSSLSDSSLLIIQPNCLLTCVEATEDLPYKGKNKVTLFRTIDYGLPFFALRAQLQMLGVTSWRSFLSLLVKMILSSPTETVFTRNPKCGANFLPDKHGVFAVHGHEVRITKAFAIQFHPFMLHINDNGFFFFSLWTDPPGTVN